MPRLLPLRPALVGIFATFPLAAVAPLAAAPLHLAGAEFDPQVAAPSIPTDLVAPALDPGEVGSWIVQFEGPVGDIARSRAERAGRVAGYLPENAFLVLATNEAVAELEAEDGTTWAGRWHPAFRMAPDIGTRELTDPRRAGSGERTLLVWAAGDEALVAGELAGAGGTVVESFPRRVGRRWVVEAAVDRVPDLARLESVLWVEEVPEFLVWNDRTTWVAQENVSASFPVWDRGLHGENQIVTVMDSGLDYNSCWFRDPGKTPGPTHRKVIDYALFGGSLYDGCDPGHGTHVCGTLAGNQTYINAGQTAANGLAYEAKLTLQDIGDNDFLSCLFGFVDVPADLTNAYATSYGLGARVHSNSWGSTANAYDGYCVDIDEFMWSHPDFLVVFAAGNSGSGGSTVGSPGTAKNCVTVGATQQAPNQNSIAWYSSRGPTGDSRTKPTLTLPGGDEALYITSANNNTGNPPSGTCATQGNPFMGTSMATPAVSASAALTRQYFEEGWYPSGTATAGDAFGPPASLVKAMLVNSARDMGAADIPNHDEGWGRVLLEDALYFDGDARETRAEIEATGVATGGTWEMTLDVEAGEALEVTLVWSDYPGTSGAGIALVNDLDLEVVGPSGTYLGNVFSGGQSTTGGSADRRNVVECVRRAAPAAGSWSVRVRGHNVPQGPQPFSVVATGAFGSWPPGGPTDAPVASVGVPRDRLALSVSPNPTRGGVGLALAIPGLGARDVVVEVYDLRGARVATPFRGALAAGERALAWDGRDSDGRPVPSGAYFVRARVGAETVSEKVTILR